MSRPAALGDRDDPDAVVFQVSSPKIVCLNNVF